jgi:hypothetical protein
MRGVRMIHRHQIVKVFGNVRASGRWMCNRCGRAMPDDLILPHLRGELAGARRVVEDLEAQMAAQPPDEWSAIREGVTA